MTSQLRTEKSVMFYFIKCLLSIYYMPDTILLPLIHKAQSLPVLKELMVLYEEKACR